MMPFTPERIKIKKAISILRGDGLTEIYISSGNCYN